MSASREKKTRQGVSAQGPTDHEQKKQQEAAAAHRSNILYATVAVVCVALAAFLLIWNSGLIQRSMAAVTVNGVKYTAADTQYHFNNTRNNLLNFYAQFGMMPFDYKTSTKDQVYDPETGETWYDYLMEQTKSSMATKAAIAAKAEAENFTIPEADQASLDAALEQLKTAWVSAGYTSLKSYIHAQFGPYMTYDRLAELITRDQLVAAYSKSIQDGFSYSDADYQTYYGENADDLDTFDLVQFTIQAKVATKDADGKDIEMTDDEKAAALEEAKTAAKATAEEIKAKLAAGDEVEALAEEYKDVLLTTDVAQTRTGSSVNGAYSEWALDSARKAGDLTISEYDGGATSYSYYVVRFGGRHLDETATNDVRHILVKAETDEDAKEPTQAQIDAAKAKAQELLDQWKAGEATEDSFAALAVENSADTGSAANGGLIANITPSSNYVENFKNWATDAARKAGDTGLVDSTYGWHIMYYVGTGSPVWQLTADQALRSQDYSDWQTAVAEGYEAASGSGMKFVQG